jgi:rhodanese-related sulfurtransferase
MPKLPYLTSTHRRLGHQELVKKCKMSPAYKAKAAAVALKLALAIAGISLLLGLIWFNRPQPKVTYQDISVVEFDTILASRDPFVVDVHTPEQAHLAGTDAFIDYTQVGNRLSEFPADKNAEILIYCRTGSMSQTASQVLVSAGYTNVKNLVGGVTAWREQHQGVFLSPATYDLGTVIYGDVASADFTLQNNTNQEIILTKVSTSCSCTKAMPQITTLSAWEETTIKVTFDPAVHKDDTDLGEIIRTIYLDTNHPNFDHLTATITATVIKK